MLCLSTAKATSTWIIDRRSPKQRTALQQLYQYWQPGSDDTLLFFDF